MAREEALATRIPLDLKRSLDQVCKKLGLRKNFVVETAVREKLEDLMDTHDLQEAVKQATGFHDWESVKKEIKKAR